VFWWGMSVVPPLLVAGRVAWKVVGDVHKHVCAGVQVLPVELLSSGCAIAMRDVPCPPPQAAS